jgi:hypothetical protein
MIDTKDLDRKAIELGKLMGVLVDAEGLSVNTDWFADPVSAIGRVDTRLDHLATLIGSLLGPGVESAPEVFPDAAWYPIPGTDGGTPFHLVMPRGARKDGEIGFGLLHAITIGDLAITASVYIPLFGYAPAGASLLLNSPEHPLRFGLRAAGTSGFTLGPVTFSALKIEGLISLSTAEPSLRMEFENLHGSSRPGVYTRLEDLLDATVASWIGEVLAQSRYWLDLYVGRSPKTVGDILEAAHFLSLDENEVYHLALQNLRGSAREIALNFLFAGLDALAGLELPILPLPGGGVHVRHRESTGDYGLRIVAQIPLASPTADSGKASSAVRLSLGSWLGDETDGNNWLSRITDVDTFRPGLSIYALRRGADGTLSFAPGFDITSVGLDIRGGADAPLFDIDGYTLRGAEIRTYLDSDGWPFGCVIRLDEIGFPLAPGFDGIGKGGARNPVATSLLASGNQQGSGSGGKSTVNPTFSAQAGYVHGHAPLLEIFDRDGNATDVIWFPIQRRFGPVDCRKVGLKIATAGEHRSDPVLGVVFDGDVALGPLELSLEQLSVGAHLKRIADVTGYDLDLQGIDVRVDTGGLEVSGGLLRQRAADGTIGYSGEALIKFADVTIAALGSYTSLPADGGASLFIFAMLDRPIGGPAFFYVTGLSAGFGYNRTLKLPAAGDVQSFPLVAGLSDPGRIGGAKPSPAEALARLQEWVPPSRGDYWLAAGVQFTTFEIIKSNALLIAQFGSELVISVLGVSTLKQPQSGNTYVYAELGIAVTFRPDRGELEASALLAPSSFVMTPKARLTGGFAFRAWFDNNAEHPGDFVFTIGGYHPAYVPPAHYPKVPRVGINWQVSDSLSIVGGAYFAITPAAMMAGGMLAITYSSGPLKAWLRAQADVLLFWKPFYLIADVSVSVGVSFRIHVLFVDTTISAEIGASFHLWGPPIGGSVHVDWYVISFTISFGQDQKVPTDLTWTQFTEMLPHKTEKTEPPKPRSFHAAALAAVGSAATHAAARAAADVRVDVEELAGGLASSVAGIMPKAEPATKRTPAYLHITGNEGPQEAREVGGITLWLARAGHFQFSVGSAVPASTIVVESHTPAGNRVITGSPVAIRRVNGGISAESYRSTQTIAILRLKHDGIEDIRRCMASSSEDGVHPAGCRATPIDITGWEIEPVEKNLPQALWGATSTGGAPQAAGSDAGTISGTVGVKMSPKPRVPANCTPAMVIEETFADRVINPDDMYGLALSQGAKPLDVRPRRARTLDEIARVNDDAVAARRGALFTALQKLGVNGWTNDPLPKMARDPGGAFADEPMEGAPVPTAPQTRSTP